MFPLKEGLVIKWMDTIRLNYRKQKLCIEMFLQVITGTSGTESLTLYIIK